MTLYLCQPGGELNVFPDKEAEAWIHLFVASAYLFPVIGGILSDAFLGKYKTILILSVVYCVGHGFPGLHGIGGRYPGDASAWIELGCYWFWRN